MSQENNQPPTRRRVKVIYLILFPLLAVVASASFWLQSNFATNQVPDSLTEGKPAHPSSRIGLYSIFLMADDHILDDQLKEVLARLANECHDVSSEVEIGRAHV